MTRANPRLLMCRPDHYGIEYEINAWMSREKRSDQELAIRQWEDLVALLKSLGATVELMEPVAGLPDLVFTANAGVIQRDLFVTSNFRHPERQGESEHFERWFDAHGYRVCCLSSGADFEGAGDALFCGETLYAGYRHRSEIRAHHQLGDVLGCETLGLELVDPHFYHLDTCFCPLEPGVALYYPKAFDEYGQRVLQGHVPILIEVNDEDAARFACNAVVVGKNVVLNSGSDRACQQLEDAGYTPHQTPLTEFLKAGGSAKCLTLRLDGEEAAPWK